MGWDVAVLEHAFGGMALEQGPGEAPLLTLPAAAIVSPAEAAALLTDGAAAIALGSSAAFRAAHAPGAVWTTRPRLSRLPGRVLGARRIVIFADDVYVARVALADLAEQTEAQLAIVDGGLAAWRAAGFSVIATPDTPPDPERIDFIFWNHNRHNTDEGAAQAMRNYLQWELDLPGEIAKDGLSGFAITAA
jgi:hypothetical protein